MGMEMHMLTRAQGGGTESGERRNHGGERMKDDGEAATKDAQQNDIKAAIAKCKPSRNPLYKKEKRKS